MHPAGHQSPRPLPDAEFVFGVLAHHLWRPWRAPDELDIDLADTGKIAKRALHFLNDYWTQRATKRRQRHGDKDIAGVRYICVIDQTKIHDIDADLGVVNLLQSLADFVAGEFNRH